MIYYTADLHFGSQSVLEETGRPFSSPEEMDEALIANWNQTVTDEDTIYVIGDIGSHFTPFPAEQLSLLKGHKHLIRGNHDTGYEDQEKLLDYFETVTDFLEIDDGEFHNTLCHYPIVYIQKGYMIHGHIHTTKKEIHEILTTLPRVMNAGVDVNGFRPVTLDQLIKNNQLHFEDPQRGLGVIWKNDCKKPKWKAVFRPLPKERRIKHD